MAGRVLNVYLAASMRGGGNGKGWDALWALSHIVEGLGHTPLNEVCMDRAPKVQAKGSGDDYLYNRDMAWLAISDCLIADITYPSLGVGYEVAVAIREHELPVLGLYHRSVKDLSAMFNGNTEPLFYLETYTNTGDIKELVRRFLSKIVKRKV